MITTLTALAALAAAQGGAAGTPPDAAAYARMPMFKAIDVSPDGKRFSALYRPSDRDEYGFVVLERTADGLDTLFYTEQTDEFRVDDPFWANDDRIVFTVRFNANRYGTDTVETRLMSLDPETQEIIPLFKEDRRAATGSRLGGSAANPVQIQSDVVSLLRDDPGRILVQYTVKGRQGVYSVPVSKTRRHSTVERGNGDVLRWQADETGTLRSGWGIENDRREVLRMLGPDGDWEDRSHRVAEGTPTFRVLGFPNVPGKAFVAANHETETDALYLYDVASDRFERKLFHSPESDVYAVAQQRGTGAALGVIYAEDDATVHWFGDNLARDVIEAMDRALPEDEITLDGFNGTQSHAVILGEETGRPGTYYIFDIEASAVTALPPQYPELTDVPMGRVISTSYEARDGLTIPAFVTLPPGVETLKDADALPFVVFPHGGPSARDFAGFDWWAQFMASRGYGVLQMNFRGSTGYGEAFRAAGDRQFGQAMQDDITDGAGWLVAQGHADPERLAIAGASYGGYAALMGAVKTPELFRCAAAVAPVTDLPAILRDARRYVGGAYGTRHIGRLWSDRKMLRTNSPALRAEAIRVPVLLVHGEDDRIVSIDQSRKMRRALAKNDVPHRYVELPKGSHFLDVGNNRLTFLRELEGFLGDCLD